MLNRQVHDAFEEVKPSKKVKDEMLSYILESNTAMDEKKSYKSHHSKHTTLKAASVAAVTFLAIAAIGVTAYATNFFRLDDFRVEDTSNQQANTGITSEPVQQKPVVTDGETNSDAVIADTKDTEPEKKVEEREDMISLQGYKGTKEYEATNEWNEFVSQYDQDQKILDQVGNDSNEYTEMYPMYSCYSKDMCDKLSEIVTKYNLKLHDAFYDIDYENEDDFYQKLGIPHFIKESDCIKIYPTYAYTDGTFNMDGDYVIGDRNFGWQFARSMYGYFSEVLLNTGDSSKFKQWPYHTSSGADVTLALGPDQALVFYKGTESMMVINMLGGSEKDFYDQPGGMTQIDLEYFADQFDFMKLN